MSFERSLNVNSFTLSLTIETVFNVNVGGKNYVISEVIQPPAIQADLVEVDDVLLENNGFSHEALELLQSISFFLSFIILYDNNLG